MKSGLLVFLLAFGLLLNACDSATTADGAGEAASTNTSWSECSQNETQLCNCMVDGELTEGLQGCNSDGSGWSVCDCGQSASAESTEEDNSGATDETVFACVPETDHATQQCADGDVYWFDDCDVKNDLAMACDGQNEICEGGMCVTDNSPDDPDDDECSIHAYKGCEGSNVYWYDSCDEKEDFVETCPENTICSQGTCVTACEPHAAKFCYDHNIYWYDSCGTQESIAESCDEEDFCKGCSVEDEPCTHSGDPFCYKVDLSGDWLLTSSTSASCTSFPPQTINLVIDGETATGTIGVGTVQADFTGTLVGKQLDMTATYEPLAGAGIESTEVIEGSFTTPTTFVGTVYVEQMMSGMALCQAVFEVTGDKD